MIKEDLYTYVLFFADSKKLLELHNDFVNMVNNRNIALLSIGETNKTAIAPGGAIEVHIVPPWSAGTKHFYLINNFSWLLPFTFSYFLSS